jgi:hypothetical protein
MRVYKIPNEGSAEKYQVLHTKSRQRCNLCFHSIFADYIQYEYVFLR